MTDLGSIYGTTVDGSNTLVIDFSQVQINGTLISKPPYVSWALNDDIFLNSSSMGGDDNVKISDISIKSISGIQQIHDISHNNGDFQVIVPGVYNLSYTAIAKPGTPANERYFGIFIKINGEIYQFSGGNISYLESSVYTRNCASLNCVAYLNKNDIVQFCVTRSYNDGNGYLCQDETHGSIVKIS